jgi:RNA polymerase sigma-70 factor (ECF subfamily)
MPSNDPSLELMARLRRGDDEAAAVVYRRFARRLVRLARRRLGPRLRRKLDPEDTVQTAYCTFSARFGAGRFNVGSWNDLWHLLTVLTLRRCFNRIARFHARCRDINREVARPLGRDDSGKLWEAIDPAPTPLEVAVFAETVEKFVGGGEAGERPTVQLLLQGYTAPEISKRLDRAERTVRRVRERLRRRLLRLEDFGSHTH